MLLEELIEDERAEARAEGRAEGITESVFDFLEDLGAVPDALKKRIMDEQDVSVLKRICKLAARSASIEQFQKEIQEMI